MGHMVHTALPVEEYVPNGQLEHAPIPPEEQVPGSQAIGFADAIGHLEPAGQVMQEVESVY